MMTTLPALSTPCTWNTFLARSTPMVLTCMWTTPSGDSLFNDHPLAHSMPGAGVVHHIIRVGLAGPRRLPVYPGERTSQDRRACLKGSHPQTSMRPSARSVLPPTNGHRQRGGERPKVPEAEVSA